MKGFWLEGEFFIEIFSFCKRKGKGSWGNIWFWGRVDVFLMGNFYEKRSCFYLLIDIF